MTKEQKAKLVALVWAEIDNAAIARNLDVPLQAVHAARSQLKVTQTQVQQLKATSTLARELEKRGLAITQEPTAPRAPDEKTIKDYSEAEIHQAFDVMLVKMAQAANTSTEKAYHIATLALIEVM